MQPCCREGPPRHASGLHMATHDEVIDEALRFLDLARGAWSERTIHPSCTFRARDPTGQCGVTNFGLGIWLVWRKMASPAGMMFLEGSIEDDQGVVGTHHTALRITTATDYPTLHTLEIDLTGSQFPGVDDVIQLYPRAMRRTKDAHLLYPVKQSRPDPSLRFTLDEIDPQGSYVRTAYPHSFADYDTKRFRGRLVELMRSIAPACPSLRPLRTVDLWWPTDSSKPRDQILAELTKGGSHATGSERVQIPWRLGPLRFH